MRYANQRKTRKDEALDGQIEKITDGIEIVCGDSLSLIRGVPDGSVDLVVTDPPYGISYKTGRRQDRSHRFCREIESDRDLSALEGIADDLYRVLAEDAACFVFCSWKMQDEVAGILGSMFSVRNRIVWDKGNTTAGDLKGSFGYQYEVIVYAAKGRPEISGKRHSDLWMCPRVSADKLVHQNEKPVPLCERPVLSFSKAGDTVLDPFMGSGTTGIACLNTGRRFIGIEKDPGYYDVARRRLAAEAAQGRLAI